MLSHHHTALEARAHTIRWALNKIRDVNGGKEKINLPLLVYDARMSRISREPTDITIKKLKNSKRCLVPEKQKGPLPL